MPSDLEAPKEIFLEETPVAAYIQAARNQRILARCLISSILLNVAFCISLVVMLPLKEKEPYIVEFKKASDNVVLLQKADRIVQGSDKLLSSILRTYVSDRESVDKITEASIRYPRVRDMSSDVVWGAFQGLYGNPDTGPFFQKGLKRAINITSDSHLADGIHQIEFQRIDTLDGQQGEAVTKWVAILRYGFTDRKVTEAEALRNPTGLVVTEYTLKARQE